MNLGLFERFEGFNGFSYFSVVGTQPGEIVDSGRQEAQECTGLEASGDPLAHVSRCAV